MRNDLPEIVDLWQLAAVGGRLKGTLPLQRMLRLKPLLASAAGDVAIDLRGGTDDQARAFISGRLNAHVEMICQRCMLATAIPIAVDFRLVLAHSEEQAAALPKQCDPLVAPESGSSVVELGEDELILALPIVPMCDNPQRCGYKPPNNVVKTSKASKPFAILESLLDGSKLNDSNT